MKAAWIQLTLADEEGQPIYIKVESVVCFYRCSYGGDVTIVRTLDGNEWQVEQSVDEILKVLGLNKIPTKKVKR